MKLQKHGGYASIVSACVAITIIILLSLMFQGPQGGLDIYDPVKMIDNYRASATSFKACYILDILGAIVTLIIAIALEERMKADAPNLMRVAVIAASAYSVLVITASIGGFFVMNF